LVEEFIQVNDGKPRWRELLQQYGTQTVLVKSNSALMNLLSEDSRWQKVFEDKQAVILVLKEQLHSQETNE
jgi:predicted secreted protein